MILRVYGNPHSKNQPVDMGSQWAVFVRTLVIVYDAKGAVVYTTPT